MYIYIYLKYIIYTVIYLYVRQVNDPTGVSHYFTSKSAIYTNKTKRFSTICFTQKRSSGEGNYL